MIKQLRWDKTIANDTLVTLDNVQLLDGFTTPVMQNITNKVDYIGTSYLVEMKNRLSDIEGTIWIENAWVPSLQRQRDESIIEQFTTILRITKGQLKQANTVRLYLRVITISDLTDPEGSTIPDGMLTGDWQAGSDLLWPDIPCPPKQYWATFRKCIRATFSTLAPKYQPSHFSIRLDRTLGPWHAVPKHMVPMLQIGFTTFPAATRHTSHNNNDSIKSEGILPRHRNNHSTPPHKPPYHIPTYRTRHVDAQAH